MKRNKINLTLDDLPLKKWDHNQIQEIEEQIRNSQTNYIALFTGESGTGKTMAAELLGKSTNRKVYKFDLSLLTSYYIGEKEKNLERIFSEATNKNWILLFDEADALISKRTEVRDSHDRYSNLKQFIINYPGLIILSISNADKVLDVKFDSVIEFEKQNHIEQIILKLKNYFRSFVSKK